MQYCNGRNLIFRICTMHALEHGAQLFDCTNLRTLPDTALAHARSSPSFSLQAFTSNHLPLQSRKLRRYSSLDNVTRPARAPLRLVLSLLWLARNLLVPTAKYSFPPVPYRSHMVTMLPDTPLCTFIYVKPVSTNCHNVQVGCRPTYYKGSAAS